MVSEQNNLPNVGTLPSAIETKPVRPKLRLRKSKATLRVREWKSSLDVDEVERIIKKILDEKGIGYPNK